MLAQSPSSARIIWSYQILKLLCIWVFFSSSQMHLCIVYAIRLNIINLSSFSFINYLRFAYDSHTFALSMDICTSSSVRLMPEIYIQIVRSSRDWSFSFSIVRHRFLINQRSSFVDDELMTAINKNCVYLIHFHIIKYAYLTNIIYYGFIIPFSSWNCRLIYSSNTLRCWMVPTYCTGCLICYWDKMSEYKQR